jgi:hypothetical protein
MPGKTYAESINLATVLISGLKANADRVSKRGIGSDFISNLETNLNDAKNLNNEQETLKANLKTKTDQLNLKMDDMNGLVDEGKKVVKLEFDQTQWKEFGILDKR